MVLFCSWYQSIKKAIDEYKIQLQQRPGNRLAENVPRERVVDPDLLETEQ